jgi:hypothetical protein
MYWTFEQHLAAMAGDGIDREPRLGDGSPADPWRDELGRAPDRHPVSELSAVENYLHRQPVEHRRLVAETAAALPPMGPDCRLVVLVPARTEAANIHRLLDRYRDQRDLSGAPLPAGLFEVMVLVNRYDDEADDGTAAAVERENCDRLTVLAAEYTHPAGERAPVTMARKLLTDVALWRAAQRPTYRAPLYLASEDADVWWLDPRQVALIIRTLDTDPGLDGVRGQVDHCPWIMANHPLLVLARRSWNFTESLLARRSLRPDRNPAYDFNWNRLNTNGWNTAFTAEVYAKIGGYTRHRRLDEDMDIGEKISCLRAYQRRGVPVPQTQTMGWLPTRSEGSPRRWLHWAVTGVEPYRDDNFLRREHEDAIKNQGITELDRSARPHTTVDPDRLTTALQRDLDFLNRRMGSGSADPVYRQVLAMLGLTPSDVVVSDGAVRVRALNGVLPHLERFARFGDMSVGPYPADLPVGKIAFTWRISASASR